MPAKKKKPSINTEKLTFASIAIGIISISLFNLAIFFAPIERKETHTYNNTPRNTVMINYWNQFLHENPEYLPGWLELAKLEMENERISNAFVAASEALRIDPNSELVQKTLQQIEIQN